MNAEGNGRTVHLQMRSRLQPLTRYQRDLAGSRFTGVRTARRGSVLGRCRTCTDVRQHREKEKRRGRLHPDLCVGGRWVFFLGRFFCF